MGFLARTAVRISGGTALLLVATTLASPSLCQEAAATEPASLTLPRAERLALEVSPSLKAADARIQQEEGLLHQAGLYPNPDLSLDLTRFTGDYTRKETILSFRQPIPWHGKRDLEKKAALERVEAARLDRQRLRLDLLLQVREAYFRVFFAEKTLALDEEDLQAAQEIQKAVEARVSAGDAAPLESLKASVELSRAKSRTTLARGELAAETAALNLLLGMPAEAPTRVSEPARALEPPEDLPQLRDRALEGQPEIRAREHAALAAGFAADRSRLERRPDFAAGPVFGQEEARSYFGAGVSLMLPLWNRNQGNIAAAEAARSEAVAEVEAARLAVSLLVADSYGRFRSAREQRLLYEQGLLSRTTEMVESARKSYEGGESGILDLLDARRTALAVRQEYYRASLDAALAAARLRRAVGEEAEESQ